MTCGELQWFINHVAKSDGIHMLKSVEWSPYDMMVSTLIVYTDASTVGMGIWFMGKHARFQCPLPSDGLKNSFFHEALAVYSAFCLGAKFNYDQISVYLDNTNTVDMFPTLHIKPAYNSILMSSVDFRVNKSITAKFSTPLGCDRGTEKMISSLFSSLGQWTT